MDVIATEKASLVMELEENRKTVRRMIIDSYQDMLAGKGRDYKEFFNELEKKYLTSF